MELQRALVALSKSFLLKQQNLRIGRLCSAHNPKLQEVKYCIMQVCSMTSYLNHSAPQVARVPAIHKHSFSHLINICRSTTMCKADIENSKKQFLPFEEFTGVEKTKLQITKSQYDHFQYRSINKMLQKARRGIINSALKRLLGGGIQGKLHRENDI